VRKADSTKKANAPYNKRYLIILACKTFFFMWILRFNQFLKNFFRLMSIILIVVGHYLRNWFTTGPLRKIVDPRGRKRLSRAERLRALIEDLGPTFIKFGQILADRPDLVSENLRIELKKLQSSARPFDDDLALGLIEAELGDSVANILEEFDTQHIASASIAQVYRAKLRTGEDVVIKIQRPGIKEKIKLDLILIQLFARKIQRNYPELNSFNIVNFINDFGEIILKELDFTNEMSNMLRFNHMFKDDERCYIPKVYARYCTTKLLMMEYIRGEKPDDIPALRSKGYSSEAIAENGVNVVLTMILKHGFFHADPHPGNIFIRGNNQIVLIDHGMCASLKPKQIDGLINFLMGFAEKNPHKIAKALLMLTEVKHLNEMENLEFDLDEIIQKYSYLKYSQVDIGGLFNDTFRLLIRYEIKIPSNLYMLLKTLITIQALAESLGSRLSLVDMIRPYAKEKILEKFSWSNIKSKILNSAEDYLYLVSDLPKDVRAIIQGFKTDGLRHQINFGGNADNNNAVIKSHIYRFGVVVLLGIMLICSTILMMNGAADKFEKIFFYTTITISVWVLLRMAIRSTGDSRG
jgi:ubiquinone biosynthesis protein